MPKLFFNHIAPAPPDPILDLTLAFNQDKRTNKVNLAVGMYRNEELATPVLSSVKKAEGMLLEKEKSKEYLPIDGDKGFIAKVGGLVFGDFFWVSEGKRICGIQTPGGTGALRVGADFLKHEVGEKIAISDPTWPNHRGVFARAGMQVEAYPYFDSQKQVLDFERCRQDLKGLTPGTVVLLHACCHNPTGIDFSIEQWQELSKLFLETGLLPFFDIAYQGFGKSLEEDAAAIRLFAKDGHEMLVAYSMSKNFALYAERVGALFIVTESEEVMQKAASKAKTFSRTSYSNPPLHGAKIVYEILSSPQLKKEWEDEVAMMRMRISDMRLQFASTLVSLSLKRNFRFLAARTGMFSFTGLEKPLVERLNRDFAIYMTADGRINIAGLNQKNLKYVVDAIVEVTKL